jgi:hypothetical protein
MLNPMLWEAVKSVDPNAQVHDEGDPGEFHMPATTPSGLFGDAKGKGKAKTMDRYAYMSRWGERYSMDCRACGDTRGRLYVCHRYGTKLKPPGSKGMVRFGRRSLVSCKNEECQINEFHRDAFWRWFDKLPLPRHYETKAIDPLAVPAQVDASAFNLLATVQLPEPRFPLLSDDTPLHVLRYLCDRRFDPAVLASKHQVMFCPRGARYPGPGENETKTLYEDRLLLPVWQHNRCVYWQARSLDRTSRLKYINPGASKSSLLYNMDAAMNHPNICVFEGATNTWRFGDASTALLGKGLSQGQIALMKTLWGYDGCAVVCLDEDVYAPDRFGVVHDTDLRRAEALIRAEAFPRGVGVLRLRGGDAADHDERRLWQLFDMAVARATLSVDGLGDAIVDEADVSTPPDEKQGPPRVDCLVKDRENLVIEDEDGLDGDWEGSDSWASRTRDEGDGEDEADEGDGPF